MSRSTKSSSEGAGEKSSPPLRLSRAKKAVIRRVLDGLGKNRPDPRETDPDAVIDGRDDSVWVGERLEEVQMLAVRVYGRRPGPVNVRVKRVDLDALMRGRK